MKKYNILNHYKSAHLKYYSDTSVLYHPDIEQLNLSDDEISYYKENIVIYESYPSQFINSYNLLITSSINKIYSELDSNYSIILLSHSNTGFKDKFRTLKGFLAREFKKDLGTNNIKEIEIDENNKESSFVVALKVDKKNILNFLKKDITRNFLYLITVDGEKYFNEVFLRNEYLKYLNESSSSEYNYKKLVKKLVSTSTSILQFDNMNYEGIALKLYAHKSNEKLFDRICL